MQPLLQIRALTKRFEKLEVLKGVDLDVHEGQVVSVIGSSGSGKTTLLRCVNLLEEFDGGEILIDGEAIGYRIDGQRRRRLKDRRTHLACRAGGERHREDLPRRDVPGADEVRDPAGDGAGLAGAGSREHAHRPAGRRHGRTLLVVQTGSRVFGGAHRTILTPRTDTL